MTRLLVIIPASKTGMIAGLDVAGFGLASVYIAPLANHLIGNFGLNQAMLFFGVAFMAVVCTLAMFLVNPPKGYVPEVAGSVKKAAAPAPPVNYTPTDMLKTAAFYKLWFMNFSVPVPL